MDKGLIKKSEQLYGFLLRFYPKGFRKEFGKEMQYVFAESLTAAYTENNEQGVISLWLQTVTDLGKSLVIQHVQNQKGKVPMKTKNTSMLMQDKAFVWVAAVTGLILLLPLVAMQFSSEVKWDETDFIIMGVLLFTMGSVFVLAARKVRTTTQRIIVGLVLAAVLLYIWAELAVGIFTNLGS